jgi:gliding motility-associated-like protein
MKTHTFMKALFVLLFFSLFGLQFANAQVPLITRSLMPPDYFVNEEFCFTVDLQESSNTGFGPYLRIMLPPGVQLNSASFANGSSLMLVDTSNGAPLKDPYRNSGTLADSVSLPAGWMFYILTYPVGSVTAGGVSLVTNLCLLMDPNTVTIGQQLQVLLQGGYIYGNTPTGSNGPTLGPLFNGHVTPWLYTYRKTSAPLPRHDRTPGPDWPLLYSLTVNIANQQTVTGLVFQDDLPDSLMFIPGSIVAPSGCAVNTSGITPGLPGGSFSVTCPSGTGTLSEYDVVVQYAGYAVNVLDESIGGGICDEYRLVNYSSLSTNQGPTISANDTVKVYNVTFQQTSLPLTTVPGGIVTTDIKIQVSDYISAMDTFRMVIRVEDGLDFIGNSTLGGLPISPTLIQNNFPSMGETTVTYDLVALNGGNIMPGDSMILTYQTLVRQNYQFNNAQVLARDVLTTFADAHYHLVDELPGILGCKYGYHASVAIIPNSAFKDVVGGTTYVPGQNVTYSLTMILPSGDAQNIVFTDFFPIPVHNVADPLFDLTWGNANIYAGPNHSANAPVPINISIIPGNNALVIDFGNMSSTVSPETLQVYITIPVTTVPFANGLTHSNFVQVNSDNTDLSTHSNLQLTQVWIGAPMLSLVKGVSAVQNPNAQLTLPGSSPVNSDAFNADARDTVFFVSTIRNIGGARAYNVKAVDPVPMAFTGCQLLSVTNGIGNPYPHSGNLFTAPNDTLVIDSMNAVGPDSIAYISYSCVINDNAIPYQTITNNMSVAWASAISQDSLFDRIRDSAYVRIATPRMSKQLSKITPGHAHNILRAHIGEIIDYVVTITLPEGVTDSAVLRDTMGLGLALVGIDSIVGSSGNVSSSIGPIDSLFPTVDSVGIGPWNHDRALAFFLGDLTNNNHNNAVAEKISIYYKARVLNTLNMHRGDFIQNDLTFCWKMPNTGQTQYGRMAAPWVRVVEPTLKLDKHFMSQNIAPGDTTWVSFTISHDVLSDGTAYDIFAADTLPFGMNFIPGSFYSACPSSYSVQPNFAGGVVTATWDSLAVGSTCEFRFKVAVDNTFPACNDILNRGHLYWESIFDPFQATMGNCPTNPFGAERTGFPGLPVMLNNYHATDADTLHGGVPFSGIPQITSNAPLCIGSQLQLNCTPYVGTNVTYIWATPQGADTTSAPQLVIYPVSAADSGYYSLAISVGGCLSPASTPFLVTVNQNPVVMATGDGVVCTGQDRQLTAVAYPAGNYSYSWIGPNGFISNAQNPLLTNMTLAMSGNYSVQISGGGCTSTFAAPVNIQVLPRPIVTTQNDTLTCSYGLVDLVVNCTPVSGLPPFSFYWTGPNGFASTMEDAIIPNAMNMHQGNYIVTMTDSMGCTSLPITAVMDITDGPQTPVITQQGALCPNDALTLVTTNYAGGSVSYDWTTPTGPATTSLPSLNFPVVDTMHAGLYSVVATIDGCTTLMSAQSTVVVNAAPINPAPTATYGNPQNCAGDTLWLVAQGDSSHTYLWDGPNGFTGNGPAVFVPNAGPDYNGSYQVTVSNANCTATASVTLNSILPYPTTPTLVPPMAVCEGANVIIQANPYNGNVVNYAWNTPNGLIFTTTPSLLLQPVALSDSGNYTLTVDVNGCNSLPSGTVALDVNPSPAMPTIFANQDTLCEGDTLLLGTNNFPGAAYNWSGPAGYNSTNQMPPAITGVSNMNIGVIELFIVFQGCPSAIAQNTIMVNARPAAPTLYVAAPSVCEGTPIVLSSNGTCNSHRWNSPAGTNGNTLLNPSQNTVAPTTTILPTDTAYLAGNWTAVCVAANGCPSAPSAPVNVTLLPTPTPPSVAAPAPQCEGNSILLNANSNVPNATFAWIGPNGFNAQGANAQLNNLTLAQAGAYGAMAILQGCPSDTTWTTLSIDTMPATPMPTTTAATCAGGSIGLLANCNATDYFWTGPNGFSSNLQNPSISNVSVNESGYYQLAIIQAACSSDVGVTLVNVIDNSAVPAFTANGPICEGQVLQLSAAPVSGPNVCYVWTCPGPTLDTTFTPLMLSPATSASMSGWYSLNVMIDGCPSPASAPVHVDVRPRPATPTILSNSPVCLNGNIVLATAAQADSYLWTGPNNYLSTAQQPSVITNAQAYHGGSYTLNLTVDGCTSRDTTVSVLVQVPGAAPSLTTNSPVCLGDTIRVEASAGADEYVWSYPNGGSTTTVQPLLIIPVATNDHNGVFTVEGKYGICLTETSSVTVTVGADIHETAYAGDDFLVCNNGQSTTLGAGQTNSPGFWSTNSDALIVSPGNPQTTVSNLVPGIDYTFVWTLTEAGCHSSSSDSVQVAVAHTPLANPNGFTLKEPYELLNASILLNDSLWLQGVILTVVVDPLHGTYTTNPNQSLNYIPEPSFIGHDSLMYQICLKACPDMCDRAMVRFEMNPKLIVPDLITPNGDGINDAFEMIGLDNFPQNQLLVFNRWGNEVFNATHYQNDWKGTYEGNPAPDGTYFWIFLNTGDGSEIMRGYLTVHR